MRGRRWRGVFPPIIVEEQERHDFRPFPHFGGDRRRRVCDGYLVRYRLSWTDVRGLSRLSALERDAPARP